MAKFLIIILLLFSSQIASAASLQKIKALYSSLDQTSVSQHLAFYQLYKNTFEGQEALKHMWGLLNRQENCKEVEALIDAPLSSIIDSLVSLIAKEAGSSLPELSDNDLLLIEHLGNGLSNRMLKGYSAQNERDVLNLPPHEIDIAKSVLITQMGESEGSQKKIRTYSALLDLMALQIRAKLPPQATPKQKIREINEFIFFDMGFRFPPHSLYAKDIDLYTFLPSVLDGRQGVCLGVAVLYLCLAQRLDLPLEAITPPGHIYLRHKNDQEEINIETTARGIHIESEEYLNIAIRSLQHRNYKEVIGLTHFNHASVHLSLGNYEQALASYHKARPYLPDDKLLTELMAYQYLLLKDNESAISLLKEIKDYVPDYAVYKDTMAEDLLSGDTDIEGVKAIFLPVDETRESILQKKDALINCLKQNPKFRMGWFSLAVAWLQLHRHHEALQALETYWQLDQNDPSAAYYLTMLYVDRLDYNKARTYLGYLKNIAAKHHLESKIIKELDRAMAILVPE